MFIENESKIQIGVVANCSRSIEINVLYFNLEIKYWRGRVGETKASDSFGSKHVRFFALHHGYAMTSELCSDHSVRARTTCGLRPHHMSPAGRANDSSSNNNELLRGKSRLIKIQIFFSCLIKIQFFFSDALRFISKLKYKMFIENESKIQIGMVANCFNLIATRNNNGFFR
jgi:hypothetical protein